MSELRAVAVFVAFTFLCPTGAVTLEKTLSRLDDEDDWSSSGTGSFTLQYWNSCVGWSWVWSEWGLYERLGVAFDAGESAYLESVEMSISRGAPPGYGFTGFLQVYLTTANECLFGGAMFTVPTLLQEGVVNYPLGVMVPARFAVTYTMTGPSWNPIRFRTDFSAAGPTGPAACGTCFPTTRITHSYSYGTAANPLCPGIRLNDNVCDCELLWTAHLNRPVSVEEGNWGAIKSLYR